VVPPSSSSIPQGHGAIFAVRQTGASAPPDGGDQHLAVDSLVSGIDFAVLLGASRAAADEVRGRDAVLVSGVLQLTVAKMKLNTAIESVSWLATSRYWPEWSNWKCRGVSPRVWKQPAVCSSPRFGPLLLTRNTVID